MELTGSLQGPRGPVKHPLAPATQGSARILGSLPQNENATGSHLERKTVNSAQSLRSEAIVRS
jgi:hypothetical protein